MEARGGTGSICWYRMRSNTPSSIATALNRCGYLLIHRAAVMDPLVPINNTINK